MMKAALAFFLVQIVMILSMIAYYFAFETDSFRYMQGRKHASALMLWAFLCNHWLFVGHYLEVASLFRTTFQRHTFEDLSILK